MRCLLSFLGFAIGLALPLSPILAQTAALSAELQLKTGVLAAPAESRAGATVYGFNEKNETMLLRKGTNDLVCLADNPGQKGFSVACFHKDLLPFMQRGWKLKEEGKNPAQVMEIREAEVKAKKWKMPKQPTSLTVYSTKDEDYDAAAGEVKNANFRYVVYIPYATAASTGLPLKPEAPGMPWIMDPGTHRAHIMINPPAGK
ncbi:MAG: hypothetical protein H7Y12_05380 [Sphingobacteriaceae bacterium]|nr:hypothetical protein [Cytophagaceae bacterium]